MHLPNGEWCTDDLMLQEEAQNFFKQLFCAPTNVNIIPFDVQQVPKLSEDMSQRLVRPVTMEEVEDALSAMHPYKSPGPDGFQGVFFKAFWPVVREDIFSLNSQAFLLAILIPLLLKLLLL